MARGLHIRPATPDDFDTLLAIDQACFDQAIAYDAGELQYYIDAPEATTLVAEVDGHAVGFLVVDVERHHRGSHVGVLVTLDVVESARRHGIGSKLLDRSERILAQAGVARYRLQVDTTNQTAVDFYRNRGFTALGTLEQYYGAGADAYLMEKTLDVG